MEGKLKTKEEIGHGGALPDLTSAMMSDYVIFDKL